jgi:ketosteroid isomerase-like protein
MIEANAFVAMIRQCGCGVVAILLAGLLGCSQPQAREGRAQVDINREVIMQTYAAFQRGDVEGILTFFDESVVWVVPGPSIIPFAGRFEGKEGVRRFFRAAVDSLDVLEQKTLETIADGDRVLVTGYERMRVRATGKEISSRWMHVYRLRNGKIIAFEEFVDTAAQASGFTPDAAMR